jgi:hypothetical protein
MAVDLPTLRTTHAAHHASHSPLQLPEERAAELLGGAEAYPLDSLVVRRYKGLVEQYGFAGGIYVQVGGGAQASCGVAPEGW